MEQHRRDVRGHDPALEQIRFRPSVSAVIPAYNAGETIEHAIDSVYRQTYDRIIEVIVVDDGSADNTAALVHKEYPSVTLLQQDNRGNAGARNTGVAHATGEYIAFLDADDEWLPGKIDSQVAVIEHHPGLTLLTCEVANHTRRNQVRDAPTDAPALRHITFEECIHHQLPGRVQFCCSGWMARRECFETLQFDEKLRQGVDWEYALRLTGRGYSMGAVLQPLYSYRIRTDSVSNSERGKAATPENNRRIIRRYDPDGNGWESDLLSTEEFNELLCHTYASEGRHQWRGGAKKRSQECFMLAHKHAQLCSSSSFGYRAWAIAPGLCHAVSRLRGKD